MIFSVPRKSIKAPSPETRQVLEEALRTGVPPACSLADDFEHLLAPQHLSQAAPGGARRAVARHTFADKSHSQLLVTRGAALTHAPPSSSTSSSGGAALQDSDEATGSSSSSSSSSSSTSSTSTSSSSSSSSSSGLPFYLVPRLEPFSRISGICTIVGDRETPSREKHALTVGDFIRVGSVGLVVTEARVSPNAAAVRQTIAWLAPQAQTTLSKARFLLLYWCVTRLW
jgi:hypothetical protein